MSHLSAIGFNASSQDDMEAAICKALDRAAPPAELGEWAGRHVFFRDPSGAAIAAHLDDKGHINCITPFFMPPDGGTRWKVQTRAPHPDKECGDCGGADCDVMAGSPPDMVTRSAVQWLYYDAYAGWLRRAHSYELRVAAFASKLGLCASDEEFEAVQAAEFGGSRNPGEKIEPGKPIRLADEAFMAYGMFEYEGDLGNRACALVTGHVEQLSHPTNELTQQRFTWARVRTLGGSLDVVAPFESEVVLTPGMLAFANVWIVGRPIEPPPPKKRPWWLKLVGQ